MANDAIIQNAPSVSQSHPAAHGGVRGMAFDRRSSQFEGRFGRLFRSLPAAQWSDAALREQIGRASCRERVCLAV